MAIRPVDVVLGPQNYAKGLLDQLGDVDGQPIIYTDDRQVTMLFVRVDQISSDTIPPTVFFSALRAALVSESIRFASDRCDADPVGRDDEWELRLISGTPRAVGCKR